MAFIVRQEARVDVLTRHITGAGYARAARNRAWHATSRHSSGRGGRPEIVDVRYAAIVFSLRNSSRRPERLHVMPASKLSFVISLLLDKCRRPMIEA
jgi:hypothetical protein